jgi:hypothetical protein
MQHALSTLRLVWPGEAPPDEGAIRALLEPYAASVPPTWWLAPSEWAQGWRAPEGDVTTVFLQPGDFQRMAYVVLMSPIEEERKQAVLDAPWALCFTTRLDADDPLASFARQIRLALTACPDALAVHDVDSRRMRNADHFRAIASWQTPPPVTELYAVHAVHPENQRGRWWLHTHGLQRAGIPDVEVLGIPTNLVEGAGDLLNDFVRAHVGQSVPPRGESNGLFLDHRIGWIPVAETIAYLKPSDAGGPPDRGGPGCHDGRRVALVQRSRGGAGWAPPLGLARAYLRGEACVRIPDAESERARRLARERWSLFARLYAEHGHDPAWEFRACVGVPSSIGNEYLWGTVEDLLPDRFLLRLENEPRGIRGLALRDASWRTLDQVADWSILDPKGGVGPATVRRIRRETKPCGCDAPVDEGPV